MKRFYPLCLAAIFVVTLLTSFTSAAMIEVRVFINGKQLKSDKNAYIDNGRTMVPARSIFEQLGATVKWGLFDNSITATLDDHCVVMNIGKRELTADGEKKIMDTAPVITNGSTYVPARAVAQSFGANVEWIEDEYIVNITLGTSSLESYPAVLIPDLSDVDSELKAAGRGYSVYSITVNETEESAVASEVIDLVAAYEKAMKDIGWKKSIPEKGTALFEAVFSTNSVSDCEYEAEYFVKKTARGRYDLTVRATDYIKVYNVRDGEVRDITESEYLISAEYRDASVWRKSSGATVTLYDARNNPAEVPDYMVHKYLSDGYTERMKTVTMYSSDNREVEVGIHLVEAFRAYGFHTEPVVMMYSPDGRAEYVGRSLVYERTLDGWSDEPFYVTLYSHSGKSISVKMHEKDKYIARGWYDELFVPMYYADGRKIYVTESEVWVMTECGLTLEIAKEESASADNAYDIVYITPSGSKYHVSSTCAGALAMEKALREVVGIYQPCSTCASGMK